MTVARLHLVDGTYELFRAHFVKRPPHRAPDGRELKATVGLAMSLLALLHEEGEAVTHLAVAFDNPIRSFRNDLFKGYKTEEGVPEELLAQFDAAEEAVRALGVTVWSMKEFEADDGLAAGAARFGPEVEQVRVMTPDKDLGQLIDGARVVVVDRQRQRVLDEPAFRALRGFAPRSVPDFLALTGDVADGIPGLDGWGEKSAALVLAAHPHLEDIPAELSAWRAKPRGAEKLCATLNAHREEALLYRTLATLRPDAPISATLEELRFQGVPRGAFIEWCKRVGSESLATRPTRWGA